VTRAGDGASIGDSDGARDDGSSTDAEWFCRSERRIAQECRTTVSGAISLSASACGRKNRLAVVVISSSIAVMYYRIGEVYLLQSHIEKAIASLERARSANLKLPYVRAFLASAYALKGDTERAAAELGQARRLSDRYSSIAEQTAGFFWVPKTRPLFEATYFAGLRKAGMPEE
jgi:tetratricopeptide (TPR) repeat protein